jgi:hypothetical protein
MKTYRVWLTTDGDTECVVAATSKRRAAELMGRSLYSFNQFASELSLDHPISQFALLNKDVAWVRTNRKHHVSDTAEWIELR